MILDIRQLKSATFFAICVGFVMWFAVTGMISSSYELLRTSLLAVLFLLIRLLFMKHMPSPTGSGAIVMGIGIFLNGAIIQFSSLNKVLARPLALILFILLVFIAASYINDVLKRRIFKTHFAHTIGSFAVGTWIAGISVCGIALCQRIPDWKPLVRLLVIGNIGLWLYFIYRAAGNFLQFFATDSRQKVHGVLFLSTVSTQSLVIVWKAAFDTSFFYRLTAPWLISLGVFFYLISFSLIVRRYAYEGMAFDPDKSWFNTNCIIHGAMSITGLASAVCGVVSANLILLIWLWIIFWFIIVEVVEIARAVKRIRLFGFAGGLLIYDPTQWSRNFTFGMLYAFTLNFDISQSVAANTLLLPLHAVIIHYFAWVVLILLLVEIFVFFRDRLVFLKVEAEEKV